MVFIPAPSYISVFIISQKKDTTWRKCRRERKIKNKRGQWKTKGRK
jgi:hypothetical protein